DRNEIKESYVIGANGQAAAVNALTTDNSFYYAATAEGLKTAAINSSNLADYRNWQNISGANGLPTGAIRSVTLITNDSPIVLKNDSLYIRQGGNWSLFYTS